MTTILDAYGRPVATSRNASLQNSEKVVFWRHTATRKIVVGCPENFPAPKGMEKIVCTTAAEIEKWSAAVREQEKFEGEMEDEAREAIEGPIRDYARKELQHLMANAKNNVSREFCRQALANLDERDAKAARERGGRVTYQHCESFEKGK